MILRLYLFSLYSALILSAGLVAFIIINVNPFESPFWMLLIFYAAVFLLVTSFFSLLGFYLKVRVSNREVIFAHLMPTLRQSMIVALAVTGLLFFQQIRVLNWWVAILFVLAVAMLELFFRAKKVKPRGNL